MCAFLVTLAVLLLAECGLAAEFRPAWCLRAGVGVVTEISLSCPENQLMYVRAVTHGHAERAEGAECTYSDDNECAATVATDTEVYNRCQGVRECRSVGVVSQFLDPCGKDSNYIQAFYECIPDNALLFGSQLDVCGQYQGQEAVTTTGGYLRSALYPAKYADNTDCACTISSDDTAARIVLSVLDVSIEPHSALKPGDWLEFSPDLDAWSRGVKVTAADIHTEVDTALSSLVLSFHSDSQFSRRGFWLRYRGDRPGGGAGSASLSVRCGQATPPLFRTSTVCFDPQKQRNEIFLTCESLGVINVVRAHHGYTAELDPAQCRPVADNTCIYDARNKNQLLESCMGRASCTVPVQETTVPLCSHDANYFQAYYHCVPDEVDRYNVIDVCGDQIGSEVLTREQGYIESLDYPRPYPPSVQCECSLTAAAADADVILALLDMQLDVTDGGSHQCQSDWVEYVAGAEQAWGAGVSLCTARVGDPVNTRAPAVHLNFHSGAAGKGRGFWLKYYGRKQDGSRAAVRIACSQKGRVIVDIDQDTTSKGGAAPSTVQPTVKDLGNANAAVIDDMPNTGLIVGLVAVAVLMIVVVVGMIIYKYRHRKPSSTMHTMPAPYANGDPGYSTFDPQSLYQTQQDGKSLSSSLRGGGSTDATGYLSAEQVQYRGGKTSAGAAYNNPAFDPGTANVHHHRM